MIVWRGAGILVPILWVGINVLFSALTSGFVPQDAQAVRVLFHVINTAVTAGAIFYIGRRLNRSRPEGQPTHTFFFIPMEYWSIAVVLFSLMAIGMVFAR